MDEPKKVNHIHVSASILAADWTLLGETVRRATAAGVDSIHIDVMDGHYVHNFAFGPKLLTCLRTHTDLPFVVHLEIDNPDDFIGDFARAGSDLIIVHRDTCLDPTATISKIHAHGVKAGIALSPEEPLHEVATFVDSVELLLVMSVYPGFGGQQFLRHTLQKVEKARALVNDLSSPPLIGMDGGVNQKTIHECVKAGADFLAIGTGIFGDGNVEENTRILRNLVSFYAAKT